MPCGPLMSSGHQADAGFVVDPGRRAKAHEHDFVGGFADHVDEIVLGRTGGRGCCGWRGVRCCGRGGGLAAIGQARAAQILRAGEPREQGYALWALWESMVAAQLATGNIRRRDHALVVRRAWGALQHPVTSFVWQQSLDCNSEKIQYSHAGKSTFVKIPMLDNKSSGYV